jgi:integrase
MRCPSELLRATWDDVQWTKRRMVIHSTKTEGYEGREMRLIPLWPELEAVLKEAWAASPKGEDRIITRYTDSASNLRTLFTKIIKRAGLKPWPKLFQNLRASRENELIDQGTPAHVAADWIGHSVKVQKKSYLQVSDHHFAEPLTE